MDSVTAQLLAGAVADLTRVRNRAEAKGDLDTVIDCERGITRLVAAERHLESANIVIGIRRRG